MALATDGSPFESLLSTDSVPFQICVNHFLILASNRIVQESIEFHAQKERLQTTGSEDWLLVKTNSERNLFSQATNDYISGIHIDQSTDIWKQQKAKN